MLVGLGFICLGLGGLVCWFGCFGCVLVLGGVFGFVCVWFCVGFDFGWVGVFWVGWFVGWGLVVCCVLYCLVCVYESTITIVGCLVFWCGWF